MRGSIQVGESIGPFVIVAKLGRGGMSTVYSAYETGLEREVALKVLPIDLLEEPGFTERFEREARLIAKLEHPHIVPLYNYGIDDGVPWMSLRLVRGGHFGERIERGPMNRETGLAYFTMMADALDHAHTLGVVHRDLKPQNVLLGERGELYLADFGISRLLQGRTTITSTGAVLGTPQYMSPEQAQGDQIGPATDIYSLGIMVYQWLTGVLPFNADTPYAVMFKHVNEPLAMQPLESLPERAREVVSRALGKKPESRWPSAGQFIEKLTLALEDDAQSQGAGRVSPVAAAISARKLTRVPVDPTLAEASTRVGLPPMPTPPPDDAQAAETPPTPRPEATPRTPKSPVLAATLIRKRAVADAKSGGAPPVSEPPATPPGAGGGPEAPLEFRKRVPPPAAKSRGPLLGGVAAALLLAVLAVWWLFGRDPAPVVEAPPPEPEVPAVAETPAEPPPLPLGDARLLLESDAECRFELDGFERAVLKPLTPLRLELAPGQYRVRCVSTTHPEVDVAQTTVVVSAEPTVALFEIQGKIDALQQLRLSEEQQAAERVRQAEEARRLAAEREAAEAQRLIDEAKQRELDALAADARVLEAARKAAEARRQEEDRKLAEARKAAAARSAPRAEPRTEPRSETPVRDAVAERRAAAAAEARRRDQQAQREAEAKRLADEEAARIAAEAAAAQAAAAAAVKPRRLTPIVISAPQPDYPAEALRSRITGYVEVQITIGRDGSVTNVRVLNARPRGTFERSVQSAVRNWRFEPLDEEVTVTRTINFR
jgi:serine/threonine-protein kinase